MHFVRNVTYLKNYKLRLTFENNVIKIVNLKNHLDGDVFEPLKELKYFQKVKINPDIDTIVWPNEADFSPDFLFEIGQ